MLKNKKIILGISGSIAAYKSAILLRLLMKEGAEVQVVMTSSAKNFITPLTLSTLSRKPVLHALTEEDNWNNHALLGRWADFMLIAPASANTIAKMVSGQCDNLLLAIYLSAACPVFFAPAMDEDMWHHPATRSNIRELLGRGHLQLPIEKGELASGLFGEGRMAEPETIVSWLKDHFQEKEKKFEGKTALVTAGPTFEPIDPVRFIGNYSSGKMGLAIADAFAGEGANVNLVLGPSPHLPRNASVKIYRVNTAKEMQEVCLQLFPESDMAVLAAAVADYRPSEIEKEKIKKKDSSLTITLEKTPDILRSLGERKKENQLLVGFALETNDEEKNALKKLKEKKADLIVLNSLRDEGSGFSYDTNKITIFNTKGGKKSFSLKSKTEVAKDILDYIWNFIKTER